MRLLFYTDPHLGLVRNANTTPASRAKLQKALYEQCLHILDKYQADYTICAGDLFDKFSNPEKTLLQGYHVLSKTHCVIAGNHDVHPSKPAIGTLDALASIGPYPSSVICRPAFDEVEVSYTDYRGVGVCCVPHHTTQGLFEEALDRAMQEQSEYTEFLSNSILVLHCNYDSEFADNETTLNLSPQKAEQLLEHYDYIVMGHEHQPRNLFGGRLIILGNTHPTGFSDISDKRIVIFDDGVPEFHKVWDAASQYTAYDVETIPESTERQFVRIAGSVNSSALADVAKSISSLWKSSPNLLGVKSDVTAVLDDCTEETARVSGETLPQLIAKELRADPDAFGLWEELTSQ